MSKSKGKTRVLAEKKLKRRFINVDSTAKNVDLDSLKYKELKLLLKENIRPEVMTLQERIDEVLENRLVNIKIRTIRKEELEDYAKKNGSLGAVGLLDDILENWSKRIKYGRGWRT